MGEAKRRKASDPNYGNPPLTQGNNEEGVMHLLDMDDIMAVFTLKPRNQDCMNRSLIVAQYFPGSKVQAGQVFFWDYEIQQYDTAFNFHMWIVKDGQIYDTFNVLEYTFHKLRFIRLEPSTMTVRFATKEDKTYSKNKTTDAVYFPGLDFPNQFPNTFAISELLHQTKEHGQIDLDMALETFKVPRQYVA